MTFYELLREFSIEELWYILSMRHNYESPSTSMQAECTFNSYTAAYNELLSLHSAENSPDFILSCELVVDYWMNEGAPEVYIDCRAIYPCEESERDAELEAYAIDFTPWAELIDAIVSAESISKYGQLVCAAELLWESTFHGFSAEKVAAKWESLINMMDDNFSIKSGIEEDIYASFTKTVLEEDLLNWFVNAPDSIKQEISWYFSTDVEERDDLQVTQEETLKRLKAVIDKSKLDCDESIAYVLYSMLRGLDIDERYTLLSAVLGLKKEKK